MFPTATVAPIPQDGGPDLVLPIQNTRGINQAYLRPTPSGPLLGDGVARSEWILLVENEFRSAFTAQEDAEFWRLVFTRRFGVPGGEWAVTLPLINSGGGVMDPFIAWWHRSVAHHTVPGQESAPRGRFFYRLADGTPISSGTGIGDLKFEYSFRVPGQPRLSLKLPTGNPSYLFGSGGVDLALSAENTWRFWPAYSFTAHAGVVYQSPSTLWSRTRPWAPVYTLALAYEPWERQSFVLQLSAEGSPIDNRQPYLDQTNRIITLAYSKAVKEGVWTFWVSEDGDIGQLNLNQNVNVGADFTIGIRFTQKR
ncbi:MAG: DUF3187 family protein [Armatimonadetes bacterium]|nr:DUF3187 family protein [Armatimonadota bacterium]